MIQDGALWGRATFKVCAVSALFGSPATKLNIAFCRQLERHARLCSRWSRFHVDGHQQVVDLEQYPDLSSLQNLQSRILSEL